MGRESGTRGLTMPPPTHTHLPVPRRPQSISTPPTRPAVPAQLLLGSNVAKTSVSVLRCILLLQGCPKNEAYVAIVLSVNSKFKHLKTFLKLHLDEARWTQFQLRTAFARTCEDSGVRPGVVNETLSPGCSSKPRKRPVRNN